MCLVLNQIIYVRECLRNKINLRDNEKVTIQQTIMVELQKFIGGLNLNHVSQQIKNTNISYVYETIQNEPVWDDNYFNSLNFKINNIIDRIQNSASFNLVFEENYLVPILEYYLKCAENLEV